jgi:tetratricopeptide (TPR) repeat protein
METSFRRLTWMVLWAGGAAAQHHSMHGPEKPVVLHPGLGTYSHPIQTQSQDAQKFFDQGLTLLYGFNRYEATRSFRRAAELDPQAAMPHWGIAMATGPHINMDVDGDVDMKRSCEEAFAAVRLARGDTERLYTAAAASRCPKYRAIAYTTAARALARRVPDDPEAAMLLAESLMIPVRWRWWAAGAPAPGMAEAIRILESVLRRHPDHPGANHFYIHAVEMSPNPELAVPSAQRLMGVVPNAGHLVHMPAHIWLLLGDYELAAATNERAVQLDQRYFEETGVPMGTYAGYMVHNMHFVAYARSMQGASADSIAMGNAIALAVQPMIKDAAALVDPFAAWPLFTWLRAGRWDEILRMPEPDPALRSTPAVRHFARALALIAKGQREEASKEKTAFDAALAKVPPGWIWINNKARDVLGVAAATLDARLAPNSVEEIAHWRRAVLRQDALVYDEPPDWYYPVRESLGAALLRARRPAEAESVFREGLRRSPRNPRMLFGLLESLNAQNKQDGAAWVRREFERSWKRADLTLSIGDL